MLAEAADPSPLEHHTSNEHDSRGESCGMSGNVDQHYPKSEVVLTIPELVDAVLFFLDGYRSALEACSLVSSLWDAFATRYLFASIRFNLTCFEPAEGGGARPTYTWLNGRRRVVNNVRRVVIDDVSKTPQSMVAKAESDGRPITDLSVQLIGDILATFPCLTSLRFARTIKFVPTPTAPLSTYAFLTPPTPRRLDELEINVSQKTFSAVHPVTILSLFAEVKALALLALDFTDDFVNVLETTVPSSASLCKITSLYLQSFDGDMMDPVCRAVSQATDLSNLESLSVLDHYPGRSVTHINKFITDHAPNIRTFVFSTGPDVVGNFCKAKSCSDFETSNRDTKDAFSFATSEWSSLQTAGFGLYVGRPSDYPADRSVSTWQSTHIWETSLGVLLNMPPRALSHIFIRFSFPLHQPEIDASDYYKSLCELNWSTLKHVLDRHTLVEKLELQFLPTAPWFEDMQKLVRERLPRRVRELVRFTIAPKLEYEEWQHP